jgi:hypothetical protein
MVCEIKQTKLNVFSYHISAVFLMVYFSCGTGFTVDGGPLRDLENPENVKFVETLMRGFIPEEVMNARIQQGKSSMLNVNISDSRHEDYR